MSGPTNAHININNFREKNNIHIWPSTIMQKLFPNFQPKKRKFWQLMSPTPYIYARVCFQWQVVSIVMQWRGNREWARTGGLWAGQILSLNAVQRYAAFCKASRGDNSMYRTIPYRLPPPEPVSFSPSESPPLARPAAFFPSAAQCQCQACQVTKKVSRALTNDRTQRGAQCCLQGGRMILSGGQFLKDWPFGK